jgi:hypothetical protein
MSNLSPSSKIPTPNARRYRSPNARVGIAKCNGLPIAFRRVVALSQPGSFATTRYQGVTAHKITPLSAGQMRSLAAELHPLN